MISLGVRKHRTRVYLLDKARAAQTKPRIKNLLGDIKCHFSRKKAWPLDYEIYLEMSKLSRHVFNALLETKGYRLAYDKKSVSVVIKK